MMGEVMAIFAPFWSLAFVYNASKVHHMITLILNQCFKTLDMVMVLVGRSKLVVMLPKYDNKTLLPFSIVTFHFLNLGAIYFLLILGSHLLTKRILFLDM
jgi:cbb3-type cytochrome oxidase subunit 1